MRKTVLICFMFLVAKFSFGQLVITEILYNDLTGIDSLEFIEIHNAGPSPINVDQFILTGVDYTFPNIDIKAGEYFLVAKDSAAFFKYFKVTARQWDSGALNNSGEVITLRAKSGDTLDIVDFSDAYPWPSEADGKNFSMLLCDITSDNNLASNWGISKTPSIAMLAGKIIYASPGQANICLGSPRISFLVGTAIANESAPGVFIRVMKNGLGNMPQSANITDTGSGTATNGLDYTFLSPQTITFQADKPLDTVTVVLGISEDLLIEGTETIRLQLAKGMNNNVVPGGDFMTVSIVDNDILGDAKLLLSGVHDAQANGTASAKGAEVYVIDDIADLSLYGIGSANNGGGSDGKEFTFPAISVPKGTYIHIAADSALFHQYFGFDADFISSSMNINGDDALELFEENTVIDIFGDINLDGTGTAWEYLDGWAYRVDGTGPDATTFILSNWKFGGVGSLAGAPNNSGVANPFPIDTYSPISGTATVCTDDVFTTSFNSALNMNVLTNDKLPNGVETLTYTNPSNGTVTGNQNGLVYTPNKDYCGLDGFTYTVTDKIGGTDQANVSITVNCAQNYPPKTIAEVTGNDAAGVASSINSFCQLKGIVYGVDYNGLNPIQLFMIDATGGISLFSNKTFGYVVVEGDEITVQGRISQFNGLTQISPDTLWKSGTGSLKIAANVTDLDESTESEFVKLSNLTFVDPGQWTTGIGTGFTIDVQDPGGKIFKIRIDNDIDLFNTVVPNFSMFSVSGLGSQFDNTSPFIEGYQLLPRRTVDIDGIVSTKEANRESDFFISPNPAYDNITIFLRKNYSDLKLVSSTGHLLETRKIGSDEKILNLNSHKLSAGFYYIFLSNGEEVRSSKVIVIK